LLLDDDRFLFGRRWIDCKTLYVSRCFARGEKHQAGLAKAMTKVGLRFDGRKHNAMDDAINTFFLYCKLIGELK
jgi:inhibitor of KinA sporulation pathway (predicted exonuclease)